ncbi:MAG: Rnase Y domain-containing protein, partial [Thermoanaerobaculia bacterium]
MDIAAIAVVAIVGFVVWWFVIRRTARTTGAEARRQAKRHLEEADREAEAKIREAELAAKEKLLQARGEFEKVSRQHRSELEKLERRLAQKEDHLEKRLGELAERDKDVSARDRGIAITEKRLEAKEKELDEQVNLEKAKLEQISGLTAQQATEELKRAMEEEARMEAAHLVRRIEDEAKEKAGKEAQRIIGTTIQRAASDFVSEATVSVVMLPNDEMKGRIIGREGRNIRALEMATGVDLIVDDTPEAVILSGFDPFRREIAREALDRLISDGRIHPARIEEVVEKVKEEFEQRVQQEGEAALLELNIPNVHPELVKLLGRLRYRTSYGQNVLQH